MLINTNVISMQDVIEIEKQDWRQRCPFNSTYEVLKNSAEKYEDHNAIEYLFKGDAEEQPIEISYRDLFHRVTQAANLFHSLGVTSTDVISYILPNLPETHEIIWGGEAAGIVNALNPLLDGATLVKLMTAAKTKIIVTLAKNPNADYLTPILQAADLIPTVEAVLVIDPSVYFGGNANADLPQATAKGKKVLDYCSARDQHTGDQLNSKRIFNASDIASIFHTGGTTGIPKLAPHTHENEVYTAFCISFITQTTRDTKFFIGLPLFHVNAVVGTGLSTFYAGGTLLHVTPAGFRTPTVLPNIWKIISKYKATAISAVPTVYGAMIQVPKENCDISSLAIAVCGAAPLAPDLFKRVYEYAGVQLLEAYGLTEGTVVSTMNPIQGERRIGSIGLRIPYQQLKCADISAEGKWLRDCETDEVGQLLIKGPNVFPGYLGADGSEFVDGWFNTGDLAKIDEAGYVWLTGRSKDLIIRGGHNIDPSMIENALAQHPAVKNAAAIGQPDAYAGELPCAYVDLVDGAEITGIELRDWVRERIVEKGASPAYVEVMPALPVTAIGKLFKPPLRQKAIQRVYEETILAAGLIAKLEVLDQGKAGMCVKVKTETPDQIAKVLGAFTVPFSIAE